jgi:ABC-type amino acid transport substrate-binding protein
MNRRHLLAMLAACYGLAGRAWAADGKKLRVVTADLPPLVIEHGGERGGALQEMVKELCQRMRLEPALEFVPWRRALYLATNLPAITIFPLTRLPEREKQFRWLAPLFEENYVFMAPKGGRFNFADLPAMNGHRVALLRGAAQAAILRELGYKNLVEAKSIDEVHRFLLAGMADAAFGERNIIQTSLRMHDASKEFVISTPVRTTTAWLAGSLDFTEAEAAHFQRTMSEMTADGSSRRILNKYGL